MSAVVYTPKPRHRCAPEARPGGSYPAGTVWRCDCGAHWVLWDLGYPQGWRWLPEGPISKLRRWFGGRG